MERLTLYIGQAARAWPYLLLIEVAVIHLPETLRASILRWREVG